MLIDVTLAGALDFGDTGSVVSADSAHTCSSFHGWMCAQGSPVRKASSGTSTTKSLRLLACRLVENTGPHLTSHGPCRGMRSASGYRDSGTAAAVDNKRGCCPAFGILQEKVVGLNSWHSSIAENPLAQVRVQKFVLQPAAIFLLARLPSYHGMALSRMSPCTLDCMQMTGSISPPYTLNNYRT